MNGGGIVVEGLTKRFGEVAALKGVDLDVPAGTVLGLLGPNGAGKTTIVRILSTLERPDSGRAVVAGHDVVRDPQSVRQVIAVVGQYATVDEGISGRENLYMLARLLGESPRRARARADEMLELFSLSAAGGRRAKDYSGGMRRRLDLAASLIGRPEILYLDEPSTGLDPRSRKELWDVIRTMTDDGMTLLLTTQHMEEAEVLADDVVVVGHGRVIARGTPKELRSKVGGQLLYVQTALGDLAEARAALVGAGLTPVAAPPDAPDASGENVLHMALARDGDLTAALRALAGANVTVSGFGTRTPSLDEVFLALTREDS
ncbi:ATP-binding cassette domain-containing protein [Nonomuraea guangzhouensis]|uniref:ATP-binding cassette domain-containing protein n=1 Tax=Nonomuraea guangzhouensis TaxID=1291555 RepID=A0ABW4GV29_9ACTN|nr:ATP-binding cassette domain-containing protein [Nonomuraea guangzhouensis]